MTVKKWDGVIGPVLVTINRLLLGTDEFVKEEETVLLENGRTVLFLGGFTSDEDISRVVGSLQQITALFLTPKTLVLLPIIQPATLVVSSALPLPGEYEDYYQCVYHHTETMGQYAPQKLYIKRSQAKRAVNS